LSVKLTSMELNQVPGEYNTGYFPTNHSHCPGSNLAQHNGAR